MEVVKNDNLSIFHIFDIYIKQLGERCLKMKITISDMN